MDSEPAPSPVTPAGWYSAEGDPTDVLRYWDGTAWTAHLTPDPAALARTEAATQVVATTTAAPDKSPLPAMAEAPAQIEPDATSLADQIMARRAAAAAEAEEDARQRAAKLEAERARADAEAAVRVQDSDGESNSGFQDPFAPSIPKVQLASASSRIKAAVIDWVIKMIVGIPFGVLGFASVFRDLDENGQAAMDAIEAGQVSTTIIMLSAAYVFAIFLYRMVGDAVLGGTLGKMAVGIRVVSAEDGSPVGVSQAVVRNLNYAILPLPGLVPVANDITSLLVLGASGLSYLIGVISFGLLLFANRSRTVMDLAAGTVVVT